MSEQGAPEHCACDVLVLGCGNELFGDDGFGPAVARRLLSGWNTYSSPVEPPAGACVLDAGTAVRTVLFDVLLGPVRPRRVVVVDAVDMGRRPGEVWCIDAGDLPQVKLDDFSMHQVPTSNMLRELSELAGVEVTCVVGQVSGFPREVRPGLSAPVEQAVDRAVEIVLQYCRGPCRSGSPPGGPQPSQRVRDEGEWTGGRRGAGDQRQRPGPEFCRGGGVAAGRRAHPPLLRLRHLCRGMPRH